MTMATTEAGEGASPSNQPANVRHRTQQLQQEYPQPATTAGTVSSTATATANAVANAQAVNAVSDLPMAQNSYDELSLIGNGAYGTVYLGRDKNHEDRLVALKKIRITLTDDGVPVNALREIVLLKQLEKFEHPNIVRLLDICHGRLERESRLTLILVFEYVEQDLDTFLKNAPSPSLEPITIKNMMHQVLCGVDFLHQNRIIHRDLKPQNLLVDRFQRVKIADFGLARIYDFHMRLTTMVVTLWYRAPEVLLSNSYATPVDIWSCGCIFAELFRRRPIFEGQTEGDQLQRIFDVIGKPLESEWPRDVSLSLTNFRDHIGRPLDDIVPEITPDAVDLLRKLLKFVPDSRICASEALNHPYFRGLTIPRVSSTSNRSTPTQQLLASNPPRSSSLSTTPSSISQRHPPSPNTITISTATVSSNPTSQPISSNRNSIISISASTIGGNSDSMCKHSSANDENNPNAGNSSSVPTNRNNNNSHSTNNNSSTAETLSVSDPKLTESEATSNPPVSTQERTPTTLSCPQSLP